MRQCDRLRPISLTGDKHLAAASGGDLRERPQSGWVEPNDVTKNLLSIVGSRTGIPHDFYSISLSATTIINLSTCIEL
jgi:hypothetical protein